MLGNDGLYVCNFNYNDCYFSLVILYTSQITDSGSCLITIVKHQGPVSSILQQNEVR